MTAPRPRRLPLFAPAAEPAGPAAGSRGTGEGTAPRGPEISFSWGAQPLGGGLWRFRLWAPGLTSLQVRIGGVDVPMRPEGQGWWSCLADAEEGLPYQFVLPGGQAVPDPTARRQQAGVNGPSLLTAPRQAPPPAGRPWAETVIYEIHIGTFTPEGTYRAAIPELARLARLGITMLEIMPLAQFDGDRGWGYDGVLPYAPHPVYGTPDDLAALVEAAHRLGMGVLLDVVYNHFGPEGNYLPLYAPEFYDADRHTPWGAGIDYTRPAVRRFYIENALYWLVEFGFDGLRLDAVDQIADPGTPELLVELAEELRARLPGRPVHLTTEDNRNITRLHERGPEGEVRLHTAEWNDDLHNAAHVLATGEAEGYYADFAADPLGLMGRALAEGFAFQGEGGRGVPSDNQPPLAFVDFLQNHDQTGNRAAGERLISLAEPAMLEALTAILLLSPHVPLLFMGEDYGETRPFCFFAGFEGELGEIVRKGRREEFAHFASFGAAEVPDPIAVATFEGSKLDPARRSSPEGQAHLARMQRLLDLRHRLIVPHLAATGGHAGRLLLARDGALAVDWDLAGARLQLRATFAPGAPALPPAEGEEIHATGSAGDPVRAVHSLAVRG